MPSTCSMMALELLARTSSLWGPWTLTWRHDRATAGTRRRKDSSTTAPAGAYKNATKTVITLARETFLRMSPVLWVRICS